MKISYVISVRLYKGCYRHIQIDGDQKLLTLAKAIINAFDFDGDHLCAFYIDNKLHSSDSYEINPTVGTQYHNERADNTTLNDLSLVKGKKFLFEYDFGASWIFHCTVLKVLDKETSGRFEIIKSVGESPEEYEY